jgi:hypothetical protein
MQSGLLFSLIVVNKFERLSILEGCNWVDLVLIVVVEVNIRSQFDVTVIGSEVAWVSER